MDWQERRRRLGQLRQQLEIVLPLIEVDHFARCDVCGQFYDVRAYADVSHHNGGPHEPMQAQA